MNSKSSKSSSRRNRRLARRPRMPLPTCSNLASSWSIRRVLTALAQTHKRLAICEPFRRGNMKMGQNISNLFVKSAYRSSLILMLRPYRDIFNNLPLIFHCFIHLQFSSHFICSQVQVYSVRKAPSYQDDGPILNLESLWGEYVGPDEKLRHHSCGCWSSLALLWSRWTRSTIPCSTLLNRSKQDI